MRVKIATRAVVAAVTLLMAALVGCSSNNESKSVLTPPADMGVVSGTITLPEVNANQLLFIAVDQDSSDTNGYVKFDTMRTTDQVTYDYIIDSVPIGDYFVYAGVLVGHTDLPPRVDDLFGYYDTGLTPPPDPNVGVTVNDTIDASISLILIQ